jgi:hypothetical protein
MIRDVNFLRVAAFLALAATLSGAQQTPAPAPGQNASSRIEEIGCVDRDKKDGRFELTNAFWWVLYYLTGQTTGLENHIGDEVKVRGVETEPTSTSPEGRRPPTLKVSSVDVLLHANPEGVRPVLGHPDTWVSFENPVYGVRVRYPETFGDPRWQYAPMQSNFVDWGTSTPAPLVNVSILETTYPKSNFAGGGFAIFVDPDISSEGTCREFRAFWPEHTDSLEVNGINYSRTLQVGAAMGTGYGAYEFHTFQNGLCYEVVFGFAGANGTGIDVPCATQWVKEENESELMRAVLSKITFLKPQMKGASAEKPSQKLTPAVISFEHEHVVEQPVGRSSINTVGISWKTENADYVQIRYPCADKLFASTAVSNTQDRFALGICGEKTDANLPPNGSMSLYVNNLNPTPVNLVLTIEPFRDGIAHPEESKTISISAPVTPHAPFTQSEPKSSH